MEIAFALTTTPPPVPRPDCAPVLLEMLVLRGPARATSGDPSAQIKSLMQTDADLGLITAVKIPAFLPMTIVASNPTTGPKVLSGQASAASGNTPARWIAGIRYPGGTEIWCATHHGEDAWTTDRKFATRFPSESRAAMAARLLAEGDAVPFWYDQDT
jgi:hypothetical protein